jgi:hypothetical protein
MGTHIFGGKRGSCNSRQIGADEEQSLLVWHAVKAAKLAVEVMSIIAMQVSAARQLLNDI